MSVPGRGRELNLQPSLQPCAAAPGGARRPGSAAGAHGAWPPSRAHAELGVGLFILRGAAGWTLHGCSRLPAAQLPLAAAGALQLPVLGEFCPRHLCSKSTTAPSQVWLALGASFHLPNLCCRKVKGRCWLWRRFSGSSCSRALLGSHKPRCPARAMARRSGALKQAQSPKLLGDTSDAGSQGTGNPRRADPRCHMPSLWPQRAAHGMICLEMPPPGHPSAPIPVPAFYPGAVLAATPLFHSSC